MQDSLTTKFVHDWRAKDTTMPNGDVVKRWLRQSRLVAREYAFMERRDDCFTTADIKDAFLCVPQEKPFSVQLGGRRYIIAKNLPGQRLGAKAWYWHFRTFLSSTFAYEWWVEQPCLCRNKDSIGKFWDEQFVPKSKEQFAISSAVLGDSGNSFLSQA